jgi:hypothetical protein
MFFCLPFIHQTGFSVHVCFCLRQTCQIEFKSQRRTLMFLCVEISLDTPCPSVRFLYIKILVPQNHVSVCHTTATLSSKFRGGRSCLSAPKDHSILYLILFSLLYIKISHCTTHVSRVQNTQHFAPCFSASKDQAILYLILSAFYISKILLRLRIFTFVFARSKLESMEEFETSGRKSNLDGVSPLSAQKCRKVLPCLRFPGSAQNIRDWVSDFVWSLAPMYSKT